MAAPRFKMTTNGDTAVLGMASPSRSGEFTLHFSGTWTGSVQTKVYVPGQGLLLADRQPVAYKPQKTGTLTDPTTTAITVNGVYVVPVSAGEMLVLECTAAMTGTVLIDGVPSPLA